MITPEKPTVEEASVRYQALTKLTQLSLDIASARNLNEVTDKILLATKIRLWLRALQYKNYITRDQRYQIIYALIDLSGIYEFPIAPVLTLTPRPSVYINGAETVSGIPSGGAIGQVLTKQSASDYDADWQSITYPSSIATIVANTGSVSSPSSGGSVSIVGTGGVTTSAAGTTITISGPAGGAIGGVDSQIQYNNGGAFGGDSALTFNDVTKTTGVNTITFSDTPVAAVAERVFGWDTQDGTLNLGLKGGTVLSHVGQTLHVRAVNGTGGNLLKSQYRVVKVTGAQGQRLQVNLAQGDSDPNSADTLGFVAENISNNQEGFIISSGLLTNINTTGSLQSETWADGDMLFLSPYTPGYVTKVKPTGPNHTVILGFVVHSHPTQGKIFVKIDNGYELNELHDVQFTSYANKDIIYRDTSTNVWKNASLATVLGYTPANAANVITSVNSLTSSTQSFATGASGSDFNISSASSTHTFNIPDAGSSARGLVTTGTQNFAGNKNFTGKVSIGSDLNASAVFEANSTSKGLLVPRMTQTERDAISSPATGLLVFNTTDGKFNFYTGTVWSSFETQFNIPSRFNGYAYAVWSGTGLVFDVYWPSYYIENVLYPAGSGQVTLNTADPTNPRLDVIAVDSTGVIKITGTADTNPVKPTVNVMTQLEITTVLITAGATTPSITNTDVYKENAEWTGASNNGTVTFNNTTTPFAGTYCVNSGSFNNTHYIRFTSAVSYSVGDFGLLKFYLRLSASFASTTYINVRLWNSTTAVSSTVAITSGLYNFNRTVVGSYQQIVVPISAFSFTSSIFDRIEFTFVGSNTSGFKMDNIILETGSGSSPTAVITGSGNANYITKWTGTQVLGNSLLYDNAASVGVGTITPSASSVLDLTSTTKGILIPRMTTTQRDAIVSPANGLQVYNTTTNKVNYYNGTAWSEIGAGGGGTPGGSTTQVQFNDAGAFAGDAGFTYDKTTDTATIGSLNLTTIANAATDTDKFIVSDTGLIKYRTGTEVLSDIGAIANSYLDTDTTLAANSDVRIATQKATKAYTDSKFATRFARRHDYAGGYSYCGTAAFGSADSAAAWYITRIPVNANGTVGTVQRSANNSIWNNRTSLTYT